MRGNASHQGATVGEPQSAQASFTRAFASLVMLSHICMAMDSWRQCSSACCERHRPANWRADALR